MCVVTADKIKAIVIAASNGGDELRDNLMSNDEDDGNAVIVVTCCYGDVVWLLGEVRSEDETARQTNGEMANHSRHIPLVNRLLSSSCAVIQWQCGNSSTGGVSSAGEGSCRSSHLSAHRDLLVSCGPGRETR